MDDLIAIELSVLNWKGARVDTGTPLKKIKNIDAHKS
jgi:hypothetical protein